MECDNAKIIETIGKFVEAQSDEPDSNLQLLVNSIVSTGFPAALQKRYDDYQEKKATEDLAMFQEYPTLKAIVVECWKKEKFEDLAKKLDDILSREGFPSEQEIINSPPPVENWIVAHNLEAMREGWKRPYIGQTHIHLHSTINLMQRKREEEPHVNYLAVIQSSGAGKSRTVHEVAGRVFAIPFNLRRDIEYQMPNYPPSDTAVLNFIEGAENTFDSVVDVWVVFFPCLFGEISQELQSFDVAEDLPMKWRDFLETSVETTDGSSKCMREVLYDRAINATIETRKKEDMNSKGYFLCRDLTFGLVTRTLIGNVRRKSKTPLDPKDVQVLLYFDEAQSIALNPIVTSSDEDLPRSRYNALCSALSINDFWMLPVFSVMISTHMIIHSGNLER